MSKPQNATPSQDELLAIIQRQNEQIAALQAAKSNGGKITCKVGEKGGLSVYGLGRFPVTLYRSQWERLLSDATVADIRKFIADNADRLKTKEAA